MRWRLWAAMGLAVLLSLAAILAILNTPGGLEAQPTRPVTAALVGEPYTLGVENTSFRVQNGGLLPASVIVDYYDPSGVRVAHEKVDGLPTGASVAFDQATQADLPHGFAGSAVVTADQSIRTVILKRIEQGDALSLGADGGISSGSSRVYLPVTYSRFGPDGGWNTRFALQNVSTASAACVQMTYRRHDGTVVFSEPALGIIADPQCPNGGLPLAPQGVILRNQASMTAELPEQFEGSLIVETVSQDQRSAAPELLAVGADIFNSQRGSFASYKGLGWNPSGTGDLSTTVLLPLMLKNFGEGAWNTRFAVSSADPSQMTSVTLTYCCDDRLPGPGGSFRKSFVMLASTIIDQGLEMGLPDGFAGSAVITASQPLAVVDIMASALADKPSFGAFAAAPQSLAATTIWLPLVYKDFGWKGPLGVAAGWNSWFRIQVADGGSANVQVTYYGEPLPGGSISFSEAVTNSKTFDQHTDPLLPADFQGAAAITSDRPIVVAAAITSDAYPGDADALFAGFGPDLFPSPSDTTPPLALVRGWNGACYRGPGQPVDSALGSILNSVVALYRLRPDQQFDRWFAGRPEVSNITTLNPYDSLLILMGSDASWQQQPSGSIPTQADLVPGWNGVCYAGPTQDIQAATTSISGRFGVIYLLAADQTWKRFVPGRPEISNLSQLEQFSSVLILVTDAGGARWLFGP